MSRVYEALDARHLPDHRAVPPAAVQVVLMPRTARRGARATSTVQTPSESTLEARTAVLGVRVVSNVADPSAATFYVALPYPPSLNHLWRRVGSKTLLSADGRRYHELVDIAVAQWSGSSTVPPPPHDVTVFVNVPDRRKRDIDNVFKAIFDPLYRAIGLDDSVIVDLHAYKRYEKGRSGIGVLIQTSLEI